MPEKLHSRIIKKFSGVDYGSNDIDRDIEYFKDCENVELSYSGGIRGRTGYRPLLLDMGFTDIFEYNVVDINGNEISEKILVNGNLWRLKESSFTITTATSGSFGYDTGTTVSIYESSDGGAPTDIHPFSLTVNFVKFSTAIHRDLGSLWAAIVAAGHTITHPASSQLFCWGAIAAAEFIKGPYNFACTFSSIGNLQVNDIIGVPCVMVDNLNMFVPCVIQAISGLSVKLIPAITHKKYNAITGFELYMGKSIGGHVGVAATSSSCITSVDVIAGGGVRVNYVYPEPIPSAALFNLIRNGPYGTYATRHSMVGFASDAVGRVDYACVNASDSLFIVSDVPPLTYVS